MIQEGGFGEQPRSGSRATRSAAALQAVNCPHLLALPPQRPRLEMLFGQFENAVNEYFEDACKARSNNPDWTHRRGWDVPAYRNPRRVPLQEGLSAHRPAYGLRFRWGRKIVFVCGHLDGGWHGRIIGPLVRRGCLGFLVDRHDKALGE